MSWQPIIHYLQHPSGKGRGRGGGGGNDRGRAREEKETKSRLVETLLFVYYSSSHLLFWLASPQEHFLTLQGLFFPKQLLQSSPCSQTHLIVPPWDTSTSQAMLLAQRAESQLSAGASLPKLLNSIISNASLSSQHQGWWFLLTVAVSETLSNFLPFQSNTYLMNNFFF